jgi:hypothetical protein
MVELDVRREADAGVPTAFQDTLGSEVVCWKQHLYRRVLMCRLRGLARRIDREPAHSFSGSSG